MREGGSEGGREGGRREGREGGREGGREDTLASMIDILPPWLQLMIVLEVMKHGDLKKHLRGLRPV